MFPQLGPIGPGYFPPVGPRSDPPDAPRPARIEPLTGGRETADLPDLPARASERALEVARLNRPDQRAIPVDAGARADLNPPDPDAPAGPPPAFEASILDRAREIALAPPPATAPAEPPAPVVPVDGLSRPAASSDADIAVSNPYAAPPSAETRASEEVATLRRIETPYDTATVDMSR